MGLHNEVKENKVAKGKRLRAAMLNGDSPGSHFLDHQQLAQHNYSRSTISHLVSFPLVHNIIAELGQGSHNLPVQVTYNQESVVGDKEYTKLYATFRNVVDRPNGFLVATENTKYDRPTQPEVLNYWSDIAFLAWTEPVADEEKRGGDLNYVLRWTITNRDTVVVTSKLLTDYRAEEEEDEEWVPVWPGISFDADSEQAHALLGTPNGSGVAWLLVQHKRQLGHKVVKKVTLFYTIRNVGTLPQECQPNLLFWIGEVGE
ncbi:conserved hypothetical protein [Pyrenophora tritici-repentis Pt-1C-BFP]|uniref:Uncharacterized protein n=1 Tax=Pyrenophora tritici-repentis (strain Pt-1C-BFP) TaxID=426418 RepID=B2WLP1_PYRTR|nr:uncharacterized protein PTRG_10901 [Pyrenophora tritici-repentis Pt-1C-BFP]EDU43951.1 conserved hypothetical protein [Pyrenophora tritici-repentis Pt-1C-BFP]